MAVSLPIQLPVNDLGKAAEDIPSRWAPAPTQTKLLASTSPSPGHCSHLGSEPVDTGYLSVSPSLCVTVIFQVNIFLSYLKHMAKSELMGAPLW